jgi:hypothetical protein
MSSDWRRPLLRKLKRWATSRFPLMFPVRMYLRTPKQMGGNLGTFQFDPEEEAGTIYLLNTQDKDNLVDTFAEEWAHARCAFLVDMEDRDDDPDHHPSFWAEYGRLQRAIRQTVW